MPTSQNFRVDDRDVHLVIGTISQTVNVCTESNRKGVYEWKLRFPIDARELPEILRKALTISELITMLTRMPGSELELSPKSASGEILEPVPRAAVPKGRTALRPSTSDDEWIGRAKAVTELCINELVLEFLDYPFLHRVEHSIHARLYSLLRGQPHFDRHFALAQGEMLTQPIHKEWPETKPRPENEGRRGSFDLAILSPGQLFDSSLKDFSAGLLDAAIVIEMGLNYGDSHLSQDAEKLLNSDVRHGYLVHLVREQRHEAAVDSTIARLHATSTIKVAYARVYRGQRFVKLLDESTIRDA